MIPALVLAGFAAGCTGSSGTAPERVSTRPDDDTPTSFSLYPGAYRERTRQVTAIVETAFAAQRGKLPYTPVRLAYGVRGDVEHLLSLASFHLSGPDGVEIPLATPYEVRAAMDLGVLDSYSRREPVQTGLAYTGTRRLEVEFFPSRAEEAQGFSIQVDRESYLVTTLFFPRPEEGWQGVYTLTVAPVGEPEPLRIRFRFLPSIYRR